MKLLIVLLSSIFLFGCTSKKTTPPVSQTEETVQEESSYSDELANEKINITESKDLNQEFKVIFKTFSPDGQGEAVFKAKSIKELADVDGNKASENMKLIAVEIAVKGNSKNKGLPSTFNQIGDHPSPQFVLIDTENNKSEVETNIFSSAYTVAKKYFELDKLTLDGEQWVNTAIVFEVPTDYPKKLALRFTNLQNKTEFYEIKN